MATHSSSLVWRIPWRKEPGRLQSMGSRQSDTTYRLSHHRHTQIYYVFLILGCPFRITLGIPFTSSCLGVPLSCTVLFSTTVRKTTCKTGLIMILKKKKLVAVKTKFREGNGTPLQYSCLENPMDGGAWKAAVHGVATSQT